MRSGPYAGYILQDGPCRVFKVNFEGLTGYGHGFRKALGVLGPGTR